MDAAVASERLARMTAAACGDTDAYYRHLERERQLDETWLRGGQRIQWDPGLHPRAHGQFAPKLGGLTHGDQLALPSGVAVRRTVLGYHVTAPSKYARHFRHPQDAADYALNEHHRIQRQTQNLIGGHPHSPGEPVAHPEPHSPVVGVTNTGREVYGSHAGRMAGGQHVVRTDSGRQFLVRGDSVRAAVPAAGQRFREPKEPASPGAARHAAHAAAAAVEMEMVGHTRDFADMAGSVMDPARDPQTQANLARIRRMGRDLARTRARAATTFAT